MSKPLSEEQAINRIKEIHGDKYDLSKLSYIDTKSKVTLGCKIHGFFEITFNKITTRKSGCKKCGIIKCAQSRRREKEDVISQCINIHKGYYIYDNIITMTNLKDKHSITCPIHGDFEQTLDAHLAGKGCIKCGSKKVTDVTRDTEEEVINKFREVHGDLFDYSKVEYISTITKVVITCKKHGDFKQKPNNHLQGAGCPKCSNIVSKSETEVRNFIEEYVDVVYSSRKILDSKKELDIYIPSKKIAIEYNGIYYHSDKFRDSNYHLDKTNDCNDKGIKLIHIFEDEWKYKQLIVKSRLLNIIGVTENKIYGRKTTVKEVSSKEAAIFLENNHIQGKSISKIRLGLYYNNELVSLMTFGSLRKNLGSLKKEGSYELMRFCNKINTVVVGGASKLLQHFEKNYKPESLISYADRRWSDGNLYEKLNFNCVGTTPVNYFYVEKDKRLNRFSFRKDILIKQGFDKDSTEKEIMKKRGYLRIYDCGTLKYKKEYKATPKG